MLMCVRHNGEDEMKPSTERWVRSAETNYRAMLRLAEAPHLSVGICLHARLCIEKYLKAILIDEGQPVSKKLHNVSRILDLTKSSVPELTNAERGIVRLSRLENIGYPSAKRKITDFDRESEMAQATMRLVRETVRSYLGMADMVEE
jgi:HEPN domain-containing protein